ncbi:MAG: hypothetical protein AAGF12_08070 [Myxococcota bacterium]
MRRRELILLCGLASIGYAGCGAKSALSIEDGEDDPVRNVFEDARVDGDAGRPAPPPCTAAPPTPTVLVQDESFRPEWLGVRDTTLFFGARDERPISEVPGGGIYVVDVEGGPSTRLDLAASTFANQVLLGPDYLAYHEVVPIAQGGGWGFTYPRIFVETEAGNVERLETALEDGATSAAAMALTSEDEVLFARRRAPPNTDESEVWLFNIRTGELATLLQSVDLRVAISDGGPVFLYFRNPDGSGRIASYDREIVELQRCDQLRDCGLWAADGTTLYLRERGTLYAVTGSQRREVGRVGRGSHVAQDQNYLYFASGAEVRYIPKAGGAIESLVDMDNQFVQGIASDGCQVFWSTVNPPQIWATAAP